MKSTQLYTYEIEPNLDYTLPFQKAQFKSTLPVLCMGKILQSNINLFYDKNSNNTSS